MATQQGGHKKERKSSRLHLALSLICKFKETLFSRFLPVHRKRTQFKRLGAHRLQDDARCLPIRREKPQEESSK